MNTGKEKVTLSIFGKQLVVGCEKGQEAALINAAQYLDKRMREVQQSGKAYGAERISTMVALNLAYEYLEIANQDVVQNDKELNRRIDEANDKIETVLSEHRQLSL